MIVSADPGEHGVDPQHRAASEQQYAGDSGTVSPVVDPPPTTVVDPPPTTVAASPSHYVVGSTKVAAPPALRVVDRSTTPTGAHRSVPAVSKGPAPVNLGTAGSFAILTKSGVTDVPESRTPDMA